MTQTVYAPPSPRREAPPRHETPSDRRRSARPAPLPNRLTAGRAPLAGDGAATAAHYASLVLSYLSIWFLLRGTWFRGDDFEFLANRVGDAQLKTVWEAHVEHWSTGPILIWQGLYAAVGISSAAPYFAASLLMHVVAGHLLWRLMRRGGLPAWPATGLVASFLVMGAGWDNITWAFQVGFLGSFAMGLGTMLLCLRGTRSAYAAAVALSLVSLTFSGISITFVIAGTLVLVLDRRIVRAAVLAAVTGSVYVTWYLLNRESIRPPEHGSGLLDRLVNAPRWAWKLLGSSYETYTALAGTGVVLAIGLVLFFAWRTGESGDVWRLPSPDPRRRELVAWVGVTATALLQVLSFAVNRNDISTPDTSRYLYFVIALSLPLIGAALVHVARVPWQKAVMGIFIAFLVGHQGLMLVQQERQFESPQLRADTLGLARLISDGVPVRSVALAVDVNTASITKWVEEGTLGDLTTVPAQHVLDARAIGLVANHRQQEPGTTVGDAVLPGAAHALRPGDCAVASVTPGSVAAVVTLEPGETVAVQAEGAGGIAYRLVDGEVRSRTLTIETQAHETRWLSTPVPLRLEVMAVEGEDVGFCAPDGIERNT